MEMLRRNQVKGHSKNSIAAVVKCIHIYTNIPREH